MSTCFFLRLFFTSFLVKIAPVARAKRPRNFHFYPFFAPAKFPRFSIFLQKRGIAKIAAKAQKTFAKSKSRKNSLQTRQKTEKPSANAEKSGTAPKKQETTAKKRKGAPKKTRRGNRPLSVECILQSNAQKPPKIWKSCSARSPFVDQVTNPAQEAPNVLSRGERAPKKA